MNDYFDMLRFACILVGGPLLIAILAREARVWWQERKTRKSIRQMEARYWAEMKEEAVHEAEAFLRGMDKRP